MAIRANDFKWAVHNSAKPGSPSPIDRQGIKNLRSMFKSLTPQDRTEALEYVLRNNYPELYQTLSRQPTAGNFSLNSFTDGVAEASRWLGYQKDECSMLRDAFSRLSPEDQGFALDYLLKYHCTEVLSAVERAVKPGATVGLAAFGEGVQAASEYFGVVKPSDLKVLGNAFVRMTRDDQEQAKAWLLQQNYGEVYSALEGPRAFAKAQVAGGKALLQRALHPNDPALKLERSVERARGELNELVLQLDTALSRTQEATTRLRAAQARQQNLVSTYEQQTREALDAGGKEAARPAGLKLLQAKKDLEALGKSLSEVEVQAAQITERKETVLAQIERLETDAVTGLARLDAAEARAQAAAVISGFDSTMGKVSENLDRVEKKAQTLVQHAEAVEELQASGVLDQIRGNGSATPELDRLVKEDEVDTLLASLA